MLNEDLSPMVHKTNWELMRVPLRRTVDHYVVYVGVGFSRRYDESTLPDELKTKMAMILASDAEYCVDEKLHKLQLYVNTNRHSPALDEIGWRASESYFCLVLTRSTLAAMKGESNGEEAS